MIIKAAKLVFVTTKLLAFVLSHRGCSQEPVLELLVLSEVLLR